jgi:hypothetical protein
MAHRERLVKATLAATVAALAAAAAAALMRLAVRQLMTPKELVGPA